MIRTLPLTVLAHEGPQVRAYLGRMRQAGWRPERILLMVGKRHPVTRKPIGRWLPRSLRLNYAEKIQVMIQNHWPRHLQKVFPYLVESMARELESLCDGAVSLIAEMLSPVRYEDYGERVERVLVEGLRDPALADALSRPAPSTVLFTGGGILRKNLLGLPNIRFLHVHPGYLPFVRGADGLLWSMLVRGQPGASCFYMESGIDTGEIIAAEDFQPLVFDISGHRRPDDLMLYRALFSFYDPLLRAELLVTRVLREVADLSHLPATCQNPSAEGITYHFMHSRLRHAALAALFKTHDR